jgi:hypothetical protein
MLREPIEPENLRKITALITDLARDYLKRAVQLE